jgi:hypothetical protein
VREGACDAVRRRVRLRPPGVSQLIRVFDRRRQRREGVPALGRLGPGVDMTTGEARELFGYGSWATARMFSAAEALTQEQHETPVPSSFPSIQLGHTPPNTDFTRYLREAKQVQGLEGEPTP